MRRLLASASIAVLAAVSGLVWVLQPPAVPVPPRENLTLSGVTLVEPGVRRLPDRRIEISEGRIARVERSASGAGGPFAGAFVLPGLIDLHVHHPPAFALGERELFALLFLAHGVTSVRDAGGLLGSVEGHARRIEAGQVAGPRVFRCGPLIDGAPPTWFTSRVVTNAGEARKAVADLDAEGVDCIKVYNGVSYEAYAALREEAQVRGLPVIGHVPRALSIVQMGDAEIQHVMGLSRDWRPVEPGRIAWYVEASRQQGAAHTPTLVAFAANSLPAERAMEAASARLLPPHHRQVLWNRERNPLVRALDHTRGAHAEQRVAQMQSAVAALHAAGVPILAGTDTGNPFVVPGASLHRELRLLVESGLSPEQAWEAATTRAGEALRVAGLGRIEPGAPADLLVFRRDPTRDLSALDSLELVVADGRAYPVEALEVALVAQRAHFEGRLRAALAGSLARLLVGFLPGPGPGADPVARGASEEPGD